MEDNNCVKITKYWINAPNIDMGVNWDRAIKRGFFTLFIHI